MYIGIGVCIVCIPYYTIPYNAMTWTWPLTATIELDKIVWYLPARIARVAQHVVFRQSWRRFRSARPIKCPTFD